MTLSHNLGFPPTSRRALLSHLQMSCVGAQVMAEEGSFWFISRTLQHDCLHTGSCLKLHVSAQVRYLSRTPRFLFTIFEIMQPFSLQLNRG